MLVINILVLLVLSGTMFLLYWQTRRNHAWNRRKATQDFLFEINREDLRNIRNILETELKINIYDKKQNYETRIKKLKKKEIERLRFHLRILLNYFEAISIGIKNYVLDEDLCYDAVSLICSEYWRWSKPFIDQWRVTNPTIWIEFEHYATKWKDKIEKEVSIHLRKPGKKPT